MKRISVDEKVVEKLKKKADENDVVKEFGGDTGIDADFFKGPDQEQAPEKEDYFKYLDELRESGETNMFGARPYLVEEFDLEEKEAQAILVEWMKTYGKRHPKAKLKKKAQGPEMNDEYFDYLNALEVSGVPKDKWVEELNIEFGLEEKMANEVISAWSEIPGYGKPAKMSLTEAYEGLKDFLK